MSGTQPEIDPPEREGRDAGSSAAGPPLSLIELGFGAFPRIDSLNPSFRPGVRKIKLTVRIRAGEDLPAARELLDPLAELLPSLAEHRCCGSNTLRESFFRDGARPGCDMPETDNGVDLAHLIEHAIIDVQHFIARMRICSGVTCAYTEPGDHYDVFVESPGPTVGRTSAVIAVNLMSDLLEGFRPDPAYRCVMSLARLARDHAGLAVEMRLAEMRVAWGDESVTEAIEFLRRQGFLSRAQATFNFSGTPLLAYVPDEDLPGPAS